MYRYKEFVYSDYNKPLLEKFGPEDEGSIILRNGANSKSTVTHIPEYFNLHIHFCPTHLKPCHFTVKVV
jgi:hypothetical protein